MPSLRGLDLMTLKRMTSGSGNGTQVAGYFEALWQPDNTVPDITGIPVLHWDLTQAVDDAGVRSVEDVTGFNDLLITANPATLDVGIRGISGGKLAGTPGTRVSGWTASLSQALPAVCDCWLIFQDAYFPQTSGLYPHTIGLALAGYGYSHVYAPSANGGAYSRNGVGEGGGTYEGHLVNGVEIADAGSGAFDPLPLGQAMGLVDPAPRNAYILGRSMTAPASNIAVFQYANSYWWPHAGFVLHEVIFALPADRATISNYVVQKYGLPGVP